MIEEKRIYDPVSAAIPAIIAPMKAEEMINKNGLSILKRSSETRCANIWSLLVLIQKHIIPQSRNKAMKPVKNDTNGVCGINAATTQATIAMLHQGRKRHAQKLKRIVSTIEMMNFIYFLLHELIELHEFQK